jgi:hypothetical protein
MTYKSVHVSTTWSLDFEAKMPYQLAIKRILAPKSKRQTQSKAAKTTKQKGNIGALYFSGAHLFNY